MEAAMAEQLFGLGNMAALLSWALLILLPRWRRLAQAVAGVAVPALLSLACLVLVGVWLKPLKFEASLALFAFTLAWFMPMASDAFRRSVPGRYAVWGFVLPAAFEIAYIAWRASRGEASHFNTATLPASIGYSLMG